jgi:L-lactate dehydrogenase complex protein LldG
MATYINMDTSRARQAIFNRIRSAQNRPAETAQSEHEAVHDYLQRHPIGPCPDIGDDPLMRFKEQALRMSDTVDEVKTASEVPAAAAAYLERSGIAKAAIAWKTLRDFDWKDAGIDVEFRIPRDADLVGITGTFCAVAETGTLVLLSSPDTYASAALLPETHIAIVPAARIVKSMEDAFALIRAEKGELPRAVNFISGPSRTGDIEQTIVLGAHGPYRVHVIIVHDAG